MPAHRPAQRVAVVVEEAGRHVHRQALRPALPEADEHHFVAAVRPAVPRAMLADEHALGIGRRQAVA
jgi:hypothetical protein